MPYTSPLTIPILRAQIAALRSPGFRARLSQVLAAAAGKLVNDGFRSGVDPYGRPWAPLKSREGKPLLLTGRMRASFAAAPISGGFRIDGTANYTRFHQFGTKPHRKVARTAKQNARGRFVALQRSGSLLKIREHMNPGIPARPMIPTKEQGGLSEKWLAVFKQETAALIERTMKGKA